MNLYRIGILIISLIIISCNSSSKNEDELSKNKMEMHLGEPIHVESLPGTYRAILPCEDCDGIETEISLGSDEMYHSKSKHLGKSEEIFEEIGEYYLEDEGTVLILEGIDSEPVSYIVEGENLIQLDKNNQRIKGKHEKSYIFKKD